MSESFGGFLFFEVVDLNCNGIVLGVEVKLIILAVILNIFSCTFSEGLVKSYLSYLGCNCSAFQFPQFFFHFLIIDESVWKINMHIKIIEGGLWG